MREKDNVLVAFTDVPAAIGLDDIAPTPVVFDPKKADGFPKGWVVSDRATLPWSEDNKRVFFGIKEQVAAPDTTRRTTDEQQDVDVWNTLDERIQSLQMIRAEADRNFTFRQAFDVAGVTLREARRRNDARPRRRRRTASGRSAATSAATWTRRSGRPPISIASTPRPASAR